MDTVFELLTPNVVRNVLLVVTFLFLLYLTFRKKQHPMLNWALFYSFLWVFCSLFVVNAFCVHQGYWLFTEESPTGIPHDLFFEWVVFWGVGVPFFGKGKYLIPTALLLIWIDVLFMPMMAKIGLLELNDNWLIGELLLITIVFLPSQLWFRFSFLDQELKWRSLLQVLVMAFFILVGVPFVSGLYYPNTIDFTSNLFPIWLQMLFVLALPSLIAVIDLVQKGQGTPFPYDPTKKMVRSGVYAYIRNPIQWSFTWMFVPLALIYQSPILLFGMLVSVAYVVGVSNPDENDSMLIRFGSKWTVYKESVPTWYFKWHPTSIPIARIYFNADCSICLSLRNWMQKRKPFNLEFIDANEHESKLESLRYENAEGAECSSVEALASCFEHINLAWASLGWLMRLPGIRHILQIIVDTMGIGVETCQINVKK